MALFPDTARIGTAPNVLMVAGCDLTTLADQHGTPLYLYDRTTMDASVDAYRSALSASYPGRSGLTYAGKAFLCTAIAQWADQSGLWVDCTGVGELGNAENASVRRGHIVVHGVNKSRVDLSAAVAQAGTRVVDNLSELAQLLVLRPKPGGCVPQLEPSRSLVARAGVALYRVGAIKQSGRRRWVLLDGGLADNPRPALYGTRYSALPVQ